MFAGLTAAAAEKTNVKTGLDENRGRKYRENISIQIRKNKREETLRKRRAAPTAEEHAVHNSLNDSNIENGEIAATLANLGKMLEAMQSTDPAQHLSGTRAVRKLLSMPSDPPVKQVVEQGFLPLLCEFLKHSDQPTLQFEAAWALTNVGSSELTGSLIDCGCLPLLAPLLHSQDAAVREQAAWCVGNVAGDCTKFRDMVIETEGLLEGLVLNLQQPANLSMMRNVTWAVSNLFRGSKPKPNLAKVGPIVPILVNIIDQCGDEETIVDATWALSYVSDGDNDRIDCVVRTGVAPTLVKMLHNKMEKCMAPALRTLGNIVTGSDVHTQAAIDAGILQELAPLLSHAKTSIRKEAAWAASNITAGTKEQIGAFLLTQGLPEAIVDSLSNGEWSVKKEAAWTIANVCTGGNADHILCLMERYDALPPMCEMLDCTEPRIVDVLLGALEAVLKLDTVKYTQQVEECGGLETLEGLQNHQSDDIYNKARHIIEEYFGVEEDYDEDDDGLAPTVDADADAFSFARPSADQSSFGFAQDTNNHFFSQQPHEIPTGGIDAPTGFSFSGF